VRVAPDGKSGAVVAFKGSGLAAVNPGSFKLDAQDNFYVLDLVSGKVLVADADGNVMRQVALPRGGAVFTDVAIDVGGTVYAVDAVGATVWSAEKSSSEFKPLTKSMKDRMNFPTYLTASRGRLLLVDQNGNGVVVLGSDGSYQGRQLSIGWSEGLVYYPGQLCINEKGDAFLADRYNNRVQVFRTGG
jgi:NHL repeat